MLVGGGVVARQQRLALAFVLAFVSLAFWSARGVCMQRLVLVADGQAVQLPRGRGRPGERGEVARDDDPAQGDGGEPVERQVPGAVQCKKVARQFSWFCELVSPPMHVQGIVATKYTKSTFSPIAQKKGAER